MTLVTRDVVMTDVWAIAVLGHAIPMAIAMMIAL